MQALHVSRLNQDHDVSEEALCKDGAWVSPPPPSTTQRLQYQSFLGVVLSPLEDLEHTWTPKETTVHLGVDSP